MMSREGGGVTGMWRELRSRRRHPRVEGQRPHDAVELIWVAGVPQAESWPEAPQTFLDEVPWEQLSGVTDS